MSKKSLIVFTGAGMSAESGISTFRDSNGLWRNYRFEEVASPVAWRNNPELVMEFYNMRRKQLFEVEPNPGHRALVKLEEKFDVQIITQNVDDLHERAGSTRVLHLHGELKKARSTRFPELVYELTHWELKIGDTCEKGAQLRPHIVWFGEEVPEFPKAVAMVQEADIMLIIGTSLNVYPAAGLLHYTRPHCPKYLIDPKAENAEHISGLTVIQKTAGEGVPDLVAKLLEESSGY
jgi:NAD-dependent deacetylase